MGTDSQIILIIATKTLNNKVKASLTAFFSAIALILTLMYNTREENALNWERNPHMAQRKFKFTKPPPLPAYNKMTRLTIRELGLLDLDEHPFHISADPRFL